MRCVLRGQVCFEKCTLQRLCYTTRPSGSLAFKDYVPAPENNFFRVCTREKEKYFHDSGTHLQKGRALAHPPRSPEPTRHKSRSHRHEPGGGGGGWRLASLLALSLISTKISDEDAEKKESELIVMIKRGILALKVGAPGWRGGLTGCREEVVVGTDLQHVSV